MGDRVIVALYETRLAGEAALSDLLAAGLRRNAISLVADGRMGRGDMLLVAETELEEVPRLWMLLARHEPEDERVFALPGAAREPPEPRKGEPIPA